MSIEEKVEQSIYDALTGVARLIRPTERKRICRRVIEIAANIGGWELHFEQPPKDPEP